MLPSLESIRKVFPDWPSEFDRARQPDGWAMLAQDFYCAALIVNTETKKVHDWLHADEGKQITHEIAVRLHGQRAALFCMAFAVELIIKAVYVKQIETKEMKPNCHIKFGNHRITQLAAKMTDISLTDSEKMAIQLAQEIIVNGKYPTSTKPKDTIESMMLPNLRSTIEMLEPIYEKFWGYILKKQD